VCICASHHNSKLIAVACKLDYQDMLKTIVCDIADKNCMIHRCAECPVESALMLKLQQEFFSASDDVVFQQWESTDRTRTQEK